MANELGLQAVTGWTVYFLMRGPVNTVVQTSDGSLVAYVSANIAQYTISGSEQGTSGYFTASVPSGVALGVYGITAYKQAGGSPAEGDLCIGTQSVFEWTGSAVSAGVAYLPQAQAGAANGVLIAGSNAATSFTTITTSGTVTLNALTVTNAFTVSGTTSLAAVTTSGTVTFNAFTVTNAFTVSGSTSLAAVSTSGTVTLNAFTVTNATTLSGAVSLGSTLGIAGTTTLAAVTTTGTVTFNAFTVSNATTLTGAVSLGSTLSVTGTTTLATVNAGAVTFSSFTVTNATTLSGAVGLGSTLTVTGTTSLAAVSTSGTVTLNALTVSNATTLTGAVSLGSTLTVTGATSLAAVTVSGATTLTGAVSLGSTLGVTGATTFAAVTTGTVTMNALIVTNATSLNGVVTAINAGNDIRGVYVSGGTITDVTNTVSAALTSGSRAQVANDVLTYDFEDVSGEPLFCLLNSNRRLFNWAISGNTLTVYKEDGSTVAWSQTLTGTEGAFPITAAGMPS